MVCTAFRATAETLNQTAFGNVDLMKSKLDQLCLTMASALRPLQGIFSNNALMLVVL